MRRNLAELSLEKDGVKFIYLPVKDIDIQNIGTIKNAVFRLQVLMDIYIPIL